MVGRLCELLQFKLGNQYVLRLFFARINVLRMMDVIWFPY